MRNLYACIVAILITLFIFGNYYFFQTTERELATVASIVDGDTLDLEDGRRVRLLNINTPEKGEFAALESENYLKQFINRSVEVEITGREKYGRYLVRIYTPDYLNLELVKRGLAHIFLVDEDELRLFRNAQEEAYASGIGVWERSTEYGCLSAVIHKNEEYVSFEQSCEGNLQGWTIKDETTHPYEVKQALQKQFILYSSTGTENGENVYWGRGNVWNNDRDSLFVRDSKGKLVYYSSYGYG